MQGDVLILESPPPVIRKGDCIALFAYDLAMSIDLDAVDRSIDVVKARATLKRERPAPSYFQYRPAPLRVTREPEALQLKAFEGQATVEMVLYDFGAVSVAYRIPLAGPLSELMQLSDALYDNAFLLNNSRQRVEQLSTLIVSATHKPAVADLVEDYVIFHIVDLDHCCAVEEFCDRYGAELAGILRAERLQLSEQEIKDALSHRMSYGPNDLTLVDWNAALIYSKDADDVREVLEFVNVELLEMRFLDQVLDDALDRSYVSLSAKRWTSIKELFTYRTDLRQVAQLQIDSAILFEGVNNVLKLLGDQYLARVYRLASDRFHLGEWDSSILRKLEIIESIYEKISDQATSRRTEVLEWIIIVLISIEIVMAFSSK